MIRIRAALRATAIAWLAAELLLAATGLAFVGASAGAATDACCTIATPGGTCPMHHSQDEGRRCASVTSCATAATALASWLGPVAVGSPVPTVADRSALTIDLPATDAVLVLRTSRPDAPPPRA